MTLNGKDFATIGEFASIAKQSRDMVVQVVHLPDTLGWGGDEAELIKLDPCVDDVQHVSSVWLISMLAVHMRLAPPSLPRSSLARFLFLLFRLAPAKLGTTRSLIHSLTHSLTVQSIFGLLIVCSHR